MPLAEPAWVRTGGNARVEIEFDDGGVLRLTADSLAELSDLTRLSTGQRITLLSLDHGLAYYTGAPEGKDAIVLALPGGQVSLAVGSRVRLEAREAFSQIAVIEGSVRFSSSAADFEVKEGSSLRLDPANASRFDLDREVAPLASDRWNEERDKYLAAATSLGVFRYGLADLAPYGTWLDTAEFGTVWKPKCDVNWTPFHEGKWLWYEGLGYTWIAAEPWGWLPYHYGRWMRTESQGWFWAPGRSATFKPGEVYWLRGASLAGWGPLAPNEIPQPNVMPLLFLNAHTTFARFVQEALEIDPAGLARPKDPLSVTTLVPALPSPTLPASRLDAVRPALRPASVRIIPQPDENISQSAPPEPQPQPQPAADPPTLAGGYPPLRIPQIPPMAPPITVIYPAPSYTGIVIVNPRERDSGKRDKPAAAPVAAPIPAIRRIEGIDRRQKQPPPIAAPKPAEKPAPADDRAPKKQ